ncbi:carbohydrate-binding domain-containing protein [Candidatus Saccharibacteria bacterium]|nr:carbohydrate-binding domain-containing protein [Candidatus Saccharibacteria bacterium]
MDNTAKNVKNDVAKHLLGQKIALTIGTLTLLGGLTVGGIYLANHQSEQSTIVTNNADGSSISLAEGKNKIESGGTYTFTGTITNGKITVDTTDEVKIILQDVSITNQEGAAIKCKEGSNVTIELVGDNTLTSTDKGDSTDDPAAVISSDGTLTIDGNGSAKLTGNGKGIKADTSLSIKNGNYIITSTDDTIHSNNNIEITGGNLTLDTSDDAIHADGILNVAGGTIKIEKSHEGIEANIINISGGEIDLTADDDGINAQNSDGSSTIGVAGDGQLTISGGKIHVNSVGDGLDSNGKISISGGEIYVDGPTNSGNSAIDCDGEINITGGTLVAVGSSGMAQNATSATQPSVLINLSGNYAGTLTFGEISFTPAKNYQSILISSSKLSVGQSYDLSINGNNVQSISISQNIVGQGGGMMGGGMSENMGGNMGNMPGGQMQNNAQNSQQSNRKQR